MDSSFNIKVASFNCRNIKSSIGEIQQLCQKCDIVLLQETWLVETECNILNSISSDFYAKGIYAVDMAAKLTCGRPHGGLAIMWKKDIAAHCSIKTFDDCRIMGIQITSHNLETLILNVYLPYDNGSNLDEFQFYLGKLDSIAEQTSTPCIYICGDFNANIREVNKFGEELIQFCNDCSYIIADQLHNDDQDRFTYCSDAHNTCHWIDHIICTSSAGDAVQSVTVD